MLRSAHSNGSSPLEIIHVISITQAQSLRMPNYIVGTVTDFEPRTDEELKMREILRTFLAKEARRAFYWTRASSHGTYEY